MRKNGQWFLSFSSPIKHINGNIKTIHKLFNYFSSSFFCDTLRIPGRAMVAYVLTPTSAASPRAIGLSGATKAAAS